MKIQGMAVLFLAFILSGASALAQVTAAGHEVNVEAGFLLTAQQYPGDKHVTTGFTVLTSVQRSTWVGVDFRGLFTEWNDTAHTMSFEVGPRLSPNYGRFLPYAELLAGPVHQLIYSAEVGGAAGVDVRLTPRVSWRSDASYQYVIDETSRRQFSTGIVVRIDSWDHRFK